MELYTRRTSMLNVTARALEELSKWALEELISPFDKSPPLKTPHFESSLRVRVVNDYIPHGPSKSKQIVSMDINMVFNRVLNGGKYR